MQYAGSPNRVTAIDGNALQYDAAGNVTQDPINKYVYDQEGRLCAVQNILVGTSTQYVYDAEGTRVAKGAINTWPTSGSPCAAPTTANGFGTGSLSIWLKSAIGGQDTQIAYVGPAPYTAVNTVLNTNVYGGGGLLATYSFSTQQISNPPNVLLESTLTLSFAFSDWLGSKRLQINSAGQAVNTWASDPFGNYLTPGAGGNSDATDHHYTGQERDTESNNDYYGARYYASSMGRWMSPDFSDGPDDVPYADFENPQSLNLYAYVGNNPVTGVDSDGHADCFNNEITFTASFYEGDSFIVTFCNPFTSPGITTGISNAANRGISAAQSAFNAFSKWANAPRDQGCMARTTAFGAGVGGGFGAGVGATLGGAGGAALALPTGEAAAPLTVPAGAALGGTLGGGAGRLSAQVLDTFPACSSVRPEAAAVGVAAVVAGSMGNGGRVSKITEMVSRPTASEAQNDSTNGTTCTVGRLRSTTAGEYI